MSTTPTDLDSAPRNQNREASLAAALADLARRWRAGSPESVEDCLRRYPILQSDPDALLDLIYQEVLLRSERNEQPRLEEYVQRFPACAAALRPIFEVHRAIESDTQTGFSPLRDGSLATSATETGIESSLSPAGPLPHIPGFEIVERLGFGGMAVVYRARQLNLGRSVALKMVRAGDYARPEELTRLRREAETLARVPHPNIVQIHDIGEHAGSPYLALEFVAGGSLDKKLAGAPQSAEEAARLVQTLAHAVSHAHQQGVIHRDLKPANVLLLTDGTPKVTDFGLARFGDRSGETRTGDILGTPSYMAPEQAAGRTAEVGPAADIYALGAILYELLTGRPPFRGASAIETMRQVLEQEPVPVRRLQPRVPADLETICLKCLHKDAKRRYVSAEALAADLGRLLEGRPILARPVPVWERAWKWAKRRPALAALAFVSIAAVVAVIVYNVRLQSALNEANDQRLGAQAINDFLLQDLLRQADVRNQADRKFGPDPNVRVRDLLDRAAATIEIRFRDRPLVEAGIRMSIGDAYRGVGEPAKAIEQLERAVALYREHRGPDQPDTLVCTNNLASAYAAAGKYELALQLLEETTEKLKAALGEDDGRTLIGLANLANAYQSAGKLDRAVPLLEDMLKKREAKLGPDHPDTLTSMNNLANAYASMGQTDRAIQLCEKTVEKRKAKLGPCHPDTLVSINNLAFAYGQAKQLDKAIALHKETAEACKTTLGPEHPSTLNNMNNLASAYQSAKKLNEAVALFEDTLKKQEARLGADHPQTLVSAANLASAYHQSAMSERVLLERAITLYEQTLEKQKKLGGDQADALTTMNNLAVAYRDAGKPDRAILLLHEAWEKHKARSGPDHVDTVKCLNDLAVTTWRSGKLEQATPLLRQALEKLEAKLGADHPETVAATYNLAQAYFQAGRPADAEPLLVKYLQRSRSKQPADSMELAFPLNLLGDCRVQVGKHAEAIEPLREALALYQKHSPKDFLCFDTQSLLGAALAGGKKFSEAESHLVNSYQALAAMEPELNAGRRALVTAALQRIVQYYDASDQPEKAAPWRKKLMDREQKGKNAP